MLSLPSFTCVPGWLYIPLFNWLIFILVMTAAYKAGSGSIYTWNAAPGTRFFGKALVVFLILYIGLRPTEEGGEYSMFVDTFNYKEMLWFYKNQNWSHWLEAEPYLQPEWFFGCIEAFCAYYADEHLEFLIAALAYVGCSALFCVRTFGKQWFIPFVMVCAAFSFFNYGVNGVRNGMAASLIILAFSYRNNLKVAIFLCILALGIHKSIALLAVSALLAWKITNPKIYIAGWLVCIFITAAAGGTVGGVVETLGFFDDRLAGYASKDSDVGYYTGFRADFLLYSSLPIISGGYFIFKRKYQDALYIWLYNIYITANAFWVLMMYAAFSNRFAQLSWFIMPIVLIYPWFKERLIAKQEARLAQFILVCYAYTFYEHFIRHNME